MVLISVVLFVLRQKVGLLCGPDQLLEIRIFCIIINHLTYQNSLDSLDYWDSNLDVPEAIGSYDGNSYLLSSNMDFQPDTHFNELDLNSSANSNSSFDNLSSNSAIRHNVLAAQVVGNYTTLVGSNTSSNIVSPMDVSVGYAAVANNISPRLAGELAAGPNTPPHTPHKPWCQQPPLSQQQLSQQQHKQQKQQSQQPHQQPKSLLGHVRSHSQASSLSQMTSVNNDGTAASSMQSPRLGCPINNSPVLVDHSSNALEMTPPYDSRKRSLSIDSTGDSHSLKRRHTLSGAQCSREALTVVASPGNTTPNNQRLGTAAGLKQANTAYQSKAAIDVPPFLPHSVKPGVGATVTLKPSTRTGATRNKPTKFAESDDALIIKLKEVHGLPWVQIASFFEGRTPGSLQVRYCTKLKQKKRDWPESENINLVAAVKKYEEEKWSVISEQLGSKYSAESCQEQHQKLMNSNTSSKH